MDFIDKIKQHASVIGSLKARCLTEESTKHSLVLPVFNLLGYDVFNPLEVVPEYIADLGIKKGEKVDYAILDKDGSPLILIECKHHLEKLNVHHSQLFRYFAVTDAKFGILTNGLKFEFFTDLDNSNKLDSTPFLVLDFENLKQHTLRL